MEWDLLMHSPHSPRPQHPIGAFPRRWGGRVSWQPSSSIKLDMIRRRNEGEEWKKRKPYRRHQHILGHHSFHMVRPNIIPNFPFSKLFPFPPPVPLSNNFSPLFMTCCLSKPFVPHLWSFTTFQHHHHRPQLRKNHSRVPIMPVYATKECLHCLQILINQVEILPELSTIQYICS